MQEQRRARQWFLALWITISVIKIVIAARLPLFVDEAFYWQEGQHLAMAYSDLPGLTAWLTRLGTELGGQHVLAVRMPFLLMAAALPWLISHIARRWFGELAGWQAGMLVLLMPLSGTLGLLALPDVPMALATVLCLDAGARLLRRVNVASTAELAMGLAMGALSHYRFVGVIGVGLIALLLIPQGRRMLADARVWVALAVGIAAWAPLMLWNLQHADAGLRFQLLDRHPWSFHPGGAWFLLVQALLVTPLLFVGLIQVFVRAFTDNAGMPAQWRYFGILGGVSTLGFFVLGFFADNERVSFHWPLPGYFALIVALPVVLRQWRRPWRRLAWGLAGAGLVSMLAYYLIVSSASSRAQLAGEKYYPYNFAGWNELAAGVRQEQDAMDAGTRLLADNFKVGAELGFALGNADIAVLDHPLNHKHGRAPQLRLWNLQNDGERKASTLLIVNASDVPYKQLLQRYHDICRTLGPLPPARVINVDHGSQRFLLFRLPAKKTSGKCMAPAMAWLDTPVRGASVPAVFEINGWAFKDGSGLERVEVLLDGKRMGQARYGKPSPGTAAYWKISNDPSHPNVGFIAQVDATGLAPGRHWLGLRLHGRDGSVEGLVRTGHRNCVAALGPVHPTGPPEPSHLNRDGASGSWRLGEGCQAGLSSAGASGKLLREGWCGFDSSPFIP